MDGVEWEYHELAYLMLHKPAGTECSRKPSAYPSIYTLLPGPLRQRPQKGAVQGVQAVGRLDQDTTGLLLLTDDGQFIHRMNSPRHHVPKVYEVTVKHPIDERQVQRLLEGVVLDDDPKPVRAAACECAGEKQLRLTLTEGKYHQVKRMVAAVGNRVESLHRSQIGGLVLPPDLLPGPVALAGCGRPCRLAVLIGPDQGRGARNRAMRARLASGWSRCGEWPHCAKTSRSKRPRGARSHRSDASVP